MYFEGAQAVLMRFQVERDKGRKRVGKGRNSLKRGVLLPEVEMIRKGR